MALLDVGQSTVDNLHLSWIFFCLPACLIPVPLLSFRAWVFIFFFRAVWVDDIHRVSRKLVFSLYP
jgi:hypothetical protein